MAPSTIATTRHKCWIGFRNAFESAGFAEFVATAVAMELERQAFIATCGCSESYMEKIVQIKFSLDPCNLKMPREPKTNDGGDVIESLMSYRRAIAKFLVDEIVSKTDADYMPTSEAQKIWNKQHQETSVAEELIELIIKDDCSGGDAIYGQNAAAVNRSSIRCAKCGSYDIEIDCKQTRSADEPMTIFCVCLNPDCRATWRGRS